MSRPDYQRRDAPEGLRARGMPACFDGLPCLGTRWPGRLAHVAEDPVKARPVGLGREPMLGGQQVFCGRREGIQLVAEDLQGEPCVQFGVAPAPPLELTVLVVLDQVMVGVAGKGQGI